MFFRNLTFFRFPASLDFSDLDTGLAESTLALGIAQLEQHRFTLSKVAPGRPHRPRESQPHERRLGGDQFHHASPIANSRPNTTSR